MQPRQYRNDGSIARDPSIREEGHAAVRPDTRRQGVVRAMLLCMADQTETRSSVIPGLQYRNALDAIDWLCVVFGFERHAVYSGPDDFVLHAELTLGGGMIMVGSTSDAPQRHMKFPREAGVAQSHCVSLVVADADEVYARAKGVGAQIVEEIEDKPYGGRGFACLDPEGYIWHIGTYDPWAPK